jgi:hypothetical protein
VQGDWLAGTLPAGLGQCAELAREEQARRRKQGNHDVQGGNLECLDDACMRQCKRKCIDCLIVFWKL